VTRLLPSVLCERDLPLPELGAARLDGEVYAVDECFAPIDQANTSRARAHALWSLVGDRAIAEGESALWIYGHLSDPPQRHTLCVPRTNRTTVHRTGRMIVRETRMAPSDTRLIDRMRVTSPTRTAFDLVMGPAFGTGEHAALVWLIGRLGADAGACRSRIESTTHLPGRRAALERLDAVASHGMPNQPALTRYTS
jgi:transcriptional regulator with AbiEi antitoxin domain of type IV toxin-antitoxin system